ncbi:Transposon-derived Buster3 transposase-like protein [Daphnia sinensis]|uniref:Transposon-derived Buster3 transposase-like protein n=1 Tax=Daphnia sinensis TaxID=1820382 RepID=A0AAD5L477_9CRUS|nr:Transposon-derived Buster3 transposase-like protein [Daphnia sinensis]
MALKLPTIPFWIAHLVKQISLLCQQTFLLNPSIRASLQSSSSVQATSSVQASSFDQPDQSGQSDKANHVRYQQFNEAWLNDEQFKPWLEKWTVSTEKSKIIKAYCVPCNKMLGNHKTTLKDHSKSQNHIMLAPSYEAVVQQRQCLSDLVSGSVLLADAVTEYDMTLVCLLIHQNLPISSIESTVSTLRRLHPTNDRLKKTTLNNAAKVCNWSLGLGVGLKLSLYETLRKTFFSIVIDETADVKVQSQLAIMRYVREKEIGFNDSPRNDSVNCHHKMLLSFYPFGRVQCHNLMLLNFISRKKTGMTRRRQRPKSFITSMNVQPNHCFC